MYAIGKAGGAVRLYIEAGQAEAEQQLLADETLTEVPRDLGPATIDAGGIVHAAVPPVPTLAQIEAQLIEMIDEGRERQQMALLTTGGAKKYVYSRKAVEIERAAGVVAALLDALSVADRTAKYPYAHAEALLTGEKLSVVLARFAGGLRSSGRVEAIEARAQVTKRAVKAATTVAAKRAAADIDWRS